MQKNYVTLFRDDEKFYSAAVLQLATICDSENNRIRRYILPIMYKVAKNKN